MKTKLKITKVFADELWQLEVDTLSSDSDIGKYALAAALVEARELSKHVILELDKNAHSYLLRNLDYLIDLWSDEYYGISTQKYINQGKRVKRDLMAAPIPSEKLETVEEYEAIIEDEPEEVVEEEPSEVEKAIDFMEKRDITVPEDYYEQKDKEKKAMKTRRAQELGNDEDHEQYMKEEFAKALANSFDSVKELADWVAFDLVVPMEEMELFLTMYEDVMEEKEYDEDEELQEYLGSSRRKASDNLVYVGINFNPDVMTPEEAIELAEKKIGKGKFEQEDYDDNWTSGNLDLTDKYFKKLMEDGYLEIDLGNGASVSIEMP